MTKKMISDYQYINLKGYTLADVLDCISGLIEEYGPDANYTYEVESDGYVQEYISYSRLETDHEYESRLDAEWLAQNRKRAIYEKLKKEFEGE